MTVARAAQDEVDTVRKEMQEKVKTAKDAADRQVWIRYTFVSRTELPALSPDDLQRKVVLSAKWLKGHAVVQFCVIYPLFVVVGQEREQLKQLQELQRELMSSQVELDSLKTTMASSQQVSPLSFITPFWQKLLIFHPLMQVSRGGLMICIYFTPLTDLVGFNKV